MFWSTDAVWDGHVGTVVAEIISIPTHLTGGFTIAYSYQMIIRVW